MKQDEQEQISNGLYDVIDRLWSLREHPIVPFQSWPSIESTITVAHESFCRAIECFIRPCELYKDHLNSDRRPFSIWQAFLADLWSCVDFLRAVHNRLFCHDYTDVIYHHILIEEMLACFPEDLRGAQLRFLLLPSGELLVWPLQEELAAWAPLWFDQNHIGEFEAINNDEPVICFECHRERNFERQYVLAHEMFHIICRRNPSLLDMFARLAQSDDTAEVLDAEHNESWPSQIEELFCDYAAAWFFGPMYLQSFADEMSYYSAQGSDTHPNGHVRAEMLLSSNISNKACRGYKAVRRYVRLKKPNIGSRPSERVLKRWGQSFEKKLWEIGLKKYSFHDQSAVIRNSFKANIPFVTQDIRDLINSLPENRFDSERLEHYSDLVSESLRKTNLLRLAKDYVREPDRLFSVPEPLTISRSKGST